MIKTKVRLTFTDEILGTSSGNPELHREFIASKAPDAQKMEDEVAALGVDAVEEKSMTVFPRLADGTPFLYDYQIRGFFKEICGAMKAISGTKSSKIKAHKKKIDKDSILNGIDRIQDYELIVHPRCKNFLVEIYNYTWAKDKFGRAINKPIDDFNHLMDAMRYALESDTKHARILNRKELGIY